MTAIIQTLIEAIRSYNVSECVECLGEVQQDWLLTEDLNIWAGREVLTVADLEEWLNFKQGYSDFHKDVHGFRPRWDFTNETLSDWRKTYQILEDDATILREEEDEQERIALEDFHKAIANCFKAGAGDFKTALRWLMDADGIRGISDFLYENNILYTPTGQKILKGDRY